MSSRQTRPATTEVVVAMAGMILPAIFLVWGWRKKITVYITEQFNIKQTVIERIDDEDIRQILFLFRILVQSIQPVLYIVVIYFFPEKDVCLVEPATLFASTK